MASAPPFLSATAIRRLNAALAAWTAAWLGLAAFAAVDAQGQLSEPLAVVLGLAIGLVPTAPLLAVWLPLQRSWQRDRREVARAVAMWDGEASLDEFLAERALGHLSYQELRRLADSGTAVFEAREALANAELHRLGIR
jgi:hypothetical protein